LSGGTEENSENLGQDCRYLAGGLSTGLLMYEAGVLVILGATVHKLFVLYLMELVELLNLSKHGLN